MVKSIKTWLNQLKNWFDLTTRIQINHIWLNATNYYVELTKKLDKCMMSKLFGWRNQFLLVKSNKYWSNQLKYLLDLKNCNSNKPSLVAGNKFLLNESRSLFKSTKIWLNQLKYSFDLTKSYLNEPSSVECNKLFFRTNQKFGQMYDE